MEYRHRSFATSKTRCLQVHDSQKDSALFCKFIEFGQQSHWIWSANSMNLLGSFNDFALLSRWYSCAKELLHVSNESRSSQQNNLFCWANRSLIHTGMICRLKRQGYWLYKTAQIDKCFSAMRLTGLRCHLLSFNKFSVMRIVYYRVNCSGLKNYNYWNWNRSHTSIRLLQWGSEYQ